MTPCYRPLGVVEIAPAVESDIPILGELARRIWWASFRDIITDDQIRYMLDQRYAPKVLQQVFADGIPAYEILRVDGEPLAYTAYTDTEDPLELKLQQLYVHPEWQGRGLGGLLMDRVEQVARERGRSRLVLTVNRNNHRAKAAYEKRGFRVRATAQFDIGHGFIMDDFVMEKSLSQPPALP
ncbi:MAG: GNAT family N-acetyltransferase [Verrucomicrobiales bacterium]|nr:GNAT family N-acetyltransferase [Verrucomicrobiales bacterium]